jgi:hypothetical protein
MNCDGVKNPILGLPFARKARPIRAEVNGNVWKDVDARNERGHDAETYAACRFLCARIISTKRLNR